MQSNVKRPVSTHHTFRATTRASRVPRWGWGEKNPYYDFGRGVLTEELLLRKSKKLPDFLLQNITWLRTSTCDGG